MTGFLPIEFVVRVFLGGDRFVPVVFADGRVLAVEIVIGVTCVVGPGARRVQGTRERRLILLGPSFGGLQPRRAIVLVGVRGRRGVILTGAGRLPANRFALLRLAPPPSPTAAP